MIIADDWPYPPQVGIDLWNSDAFLTDVLRRRYGLATDGQGKNESRTLAEF